MSIEAMSFVWRHFEGDPTAKLVLLSLADQANNAGWSWPSQAYTAKRCMISDRQLRTWITRLKEQGWLEVHPRPGKSDMYRVTTPEAHFRTTPEDPFRTEWNPTSDPLGSPLPTNHQEPPKESTEESPVAKGDRVKCPYCHDKFVWGKPHNCSANNMLMR